MQKFYSNVAGPYVVARAEEERLAILTEIKDMQKSLFAAFDAAHSSVRNAEQTTAVLSDLATGLIVWMDSTSDGSSASREKVLLIAGLQALDELGIDLPAVCIDQNPTNASILRAHARFDGLDTDERKEFTRAIEDVWHGKKNVGKNGVKFFTGPKSPTAVLSAMMLTLQAQAFASGVEISTEFVGALAHKVDALLTAPNTARFAGFNGKLDELDADFDIAATRADPQEFVRLRNQLGANTNPAVLDPSQIRDGVLENDLLEAVNAARAIEDAERNGPSADGTAADEVDLRFQPLSSLSELNLKTAGKPQLSALVLAGHIGWTAALVPGKKGLQWQAIAANPPAAPPAAAAVAPPAAPGPPPGPPPEPSAASLRAGVEVFDSEEVAALLEAGSGLSKMSNVDLKDRLKQLGLKVSGNKADMQERLRTHLESPLSGHAVVKPLPREAGAVANVQVGAKAWLAARAAEMIPAGKAHGVSLPEVVAEVRAWGTAQIAAAAAGNTPAEHGLLKAVPLEGAAAAAEEQLLQTLRRLELKKKSAAKRHGPFLAAHLVRHSKLSADQTEAILVHLLQQRTGPPPDIAGFADRGAYLTGLLPPNPVEYALQALAQAQKIASSQSQHFAEHFSHLLRIANEQYSDWSDEWKIGFVNEGMTTGYLQHCEGSSHENCRQWLPYSSCHRGPGFHYPEHTPWRLLTESPYPEGMVGWLCVLFRSWAFSPYLQQRCSECILYARSSVCESFFHALRIVVPKWSHTTDAGMKIGASQTQLNHNEMKRCKIMTKKVESGKYSKEGVIKTRAARPEAMIWAEEGGTDLFADVPPRQRLGQVRLEAAALAKRRRITTVAAGAAKALTADKQPGTAATVVIRHPEPNYPVTLAMSDNGALVNGFVSGPPPPPEAGAAVAVWPFHKKRLAEAAGLAGGEGGARRRLDPATAEQGAIMQFHAEDATDEELEQEQKQEGPQEQ